MLLKMVSAEAVQERHFFLESLNSPEVFMGIRILGAAVLLFFIISYLKYRKK